MACIKGKGRFVQAQFIANRLGQDPIDVQHKSLEEAKEKATLKIQFCAEQKTLALFIDDSVVGSAMAIDQSGLDNWELSETDLIDVGIMGFAEKTTITSNQPTIDNFKYKIFLKRFFWSLDEPFCKNMYSL